MKWEYFCWKSVDIRWLSSEMFLLLIQSETLLLIRFEKVIRTSQTRNTLVESRLAILIRMCHFPRSLAFEWYFREDFFRNFDDKIKITNNGTAFQLLLSPRLKRDKMLIQLENRYKFASVFAMQRKTLRDFMAAPRDRYTSKVFGGESSTHIALSPLWTWRQKWNREHTLFALRLYLFVPPFVSFVLWKEVYKGVAKWSAIEYEILPIS